MLRVVLCFSLDKMEVGVTSPKHHQEVLLSCTVNLDHISFSSSSTVRNLGVIFDQDLSFNSHIKQITKLAFFHLCIIRNILTQEDTE